MHDQIVSLAYGESDNLILRAEAHHKFGETGNKVGKSTTKVRKKVVRGALVTMGELRTTADANRRRQLETTFRAGGLGGNLSSFVPR